MRTRFLPSSAGQYEFPTMGPVVQTRMAGEPIRFNLGPKGECGPTQLHQPPFVDRDINEASAPAIKRHTS